MKKLITLLLLCVSSFAVHAQMDEPVTWTSEIEKVSDTEFNLIYKAEIADKWHLYSQYLTENSGFPTEFMYDSIQQINDFKLVGKNTESEGITKFDKVFQAELTYFEGTATFTQKIEITNTDVTSITSDVIYQSCDDEKCVLGEEEFTFEIPGNATTESPFGGQSQILEPVKWKASVNKLSDDEYEIVMKASIEDTWHLYSQRSYGDLGPYPTEFTFPNAGKTYDLVGKVKESPTKDVFDKVFQMDISFYEKEATFTQKIKLKDKKTKIINAEVVYMVCDDEKCLPPTGVDFVIALDNSTIVPTKSAELTEKDILLSKELDLGITGKEEFKDDTEISEKSNFAIFFLGFLGGLIALLTPCVFPMIPLTVSFFTKSGANSQKGLFNSMLYGFFIFLVYFLLSLPFHVLDSLDPEILNNVSTNATLNVIFFIVFVVFAFSFFGYFELTLPASWSNSLDSKANNIGGIVGIFLMAMVLVIVSFSCTGPILGALLGSTTLAAGDPAMKLTMGMSGFGLALALPFTLFAMFPKWLNSLPKSGGWLNSVKVVLGFLELGLALKFLSNADLVSHWGLLKREVFIGIWVLLGIGLTLYLFGKLKFPHDSPIKKLSFSRISLGILIFAFVIYLIPGLTNTKYANLKLLSGFPPPLFYSLYDQEHGDCPLGLPCYKDLEEGIAVAKAENKPIMLDFTGWACVNCRKMEEQVWSQPEVFNILQEEYILISLYVDDRKPLPEDKKFRFDKGNGNIKKIKTYGDKMATLQTLNFNNNSQPYYVLISPNMEMLQKPVGYTPDAEEYADWLQIGIENFKNKSK
ncbi:Thiol:disulfide interchange protein DsbD [Kordia antarctica]|uniref:Thiol:disulfide interchange protein DsbD n=1 Tax=Kordia antarctica TaxID=1218801 RepID=A0A7L4ZGX7_9FLAO|nr:thioredoxin family protein [Kordia antarctica]QHI35506.1 Thiol:disulfide interchange protein DsbD [Kordia antarctica]